MFALVKPSCKIELFYENLKISQVQNLKQSENEILKAMFKGLTKYDSVQKEEFAKLRNNETIAICYWNKILNKKIYDLSQKIPFAARCIRTLFSFQRSISSLSLQLFSFALRRKNKFIQLFGALEAAQVELSCWIYSIT